MEHSHDSMVDDPSKDRIITIYMGEGPVDRDRITNLLDDAGIPNYWTNEGHHLWLRLDSVGSGPTLIQIPESRQAEARELIAKYLKSLEQENLDDPHNS